MKNLLLKSSRRTKRFIVASSDFLSFISALLLASLVSTEGDLSLLIPIFISLIWAPLLSNFIFYKLGVYDSVVRYIDFSSIYQLSFSILLSIFLITFIYQILSWSSLGIYIFLNITFIGFLCGLLTCFVLIIGSRIIGNYIFSNKRFEKKVAIYGAGSAGIQLAEALKVSTEMQPVIFFDANSALENTFIGGIKVLNPKKLEKFISRKRVDEVLIAMPSASKLTLRNLLKEIEEFSVKVRILPGFAALAQGEITVSELKEVDITDLLGRLEVEANQSLLTRNIKNKVVLITGAGGSIGSELCRQVISNNPNTLILYDTNEYALYSIKNEFERYSKAINIYSILGSVNNKKRMTDVFKLFKVDTVYHAAAYKHVSIVEENPFEAVFTNIIGTKIAVETALETGVETFVLVSTDKAVRPTNIMGATKRFAELILQALSHQGNTRMIMVRFGNVIGSSGSAVPLFQQQIKDGGPVTVTHPEITRYFMSIPEAAELVIQAGAMGSGGEVFVLDMGDPVKIFDLAKRLINLSGKDLIDQDNPEGDIEIKFTGLRPGEKLYEELLIGDNVSKTEHSRILKAQEQYIDSSDLEKYLNKIKKAELEGDVIYLKEIMKDAIPGFTPDKQVVDSVFLRKGK